MAVVTIHPQQKVEMEVLGGEQVEVAEQAQVAHPVAEVETKVAEAPVVTAAKTTGQMDLLFLVVQELMAEPPRVLMDQQLTAVLQMEGTVEERIMMLVWQRAVAAVRATTGGAVVAVQ